MTWRDFLFDEATNLAVAGPLTPEAMARIPQGFRDWALSEAAEPFHQARTGSGWRRVPTAALESAISKSIVRVADGLGLDGLEAVARASGYEHLAATLILSSDSVAVSFSHRFADGVATLTALQAIFSGRTQNEPRMSRWPILRGLAASGQLSLPALQRGRQALHAMGEILGAAPAPAVPGASIATSEFTVASARLSRVAAQVRASSGDGERVPTAAVLASLVFRAMRSCSAADVDLPIGMLVGLRHHLGAGWSTRGNFASGVIVGRLREREWTAAEFRDIVMPQVASPTPMASYAVETAARARAALIERLRGGAAPSVSGAGVMLSYNVLPGSIGLARDDYRQGSTPSPALVMLSRDSVLGPYCTTAATGKEFVITTVDDSGTVDVAGLEAAFAREEQLLLGA